MRDKKIAFVAGPPVSGTVFFGRTKILKLLRNNIHSGSSIFLVGQRRIGKTSILSQLRHFNAKGVLKGLGTYPIVVSLDGSTLSPNRTADDLLIALSRSIERSIPHQSQDVARILKRAQNEANPNPLMIADLFDEVVRRAHSKVLILFDEMNDAIDITEGRAAMLMRALISQGHVVAISTSFQWPDQFSIDSPWFNAFKVMTLGPFSQDESIQMLKTLSRRSGREFSDNECLFLTDIVGNHPFYLQSIGFKLFAEHSYISLSDRERESHLRLAIKELSGDLYWHLQYLIEHLSVDDLDSLTRIANEKSPAITHHLQRLLWLGIIDLEEGRYVISSGMLREFLLELPRPSLNKRIRESAAWSTISTFAKKSLEVGLEKAAGVAAEKYLK